MFRRIVAIFISLLLWTGCAGPQTDRATVTPGTSPTAPPTLIPATATKEVSKAESFPVVRIKNAETGTYLIESDGQAQLGAMSDEASKWIMEEYQGAKRLQNQVSKNYLSIENLKEYVEVIPIHTEWMSPRWVFDGDPSQGPILIRNVWHNWQILYVKDGQVSYERVPAEADNARWILEPVDGEVLVSDTPTVFVIPPATNPSGSRGAVVPWIEYEAEQETTNGEILVPDRTFGTVASESSGRSAVKLDQVGKYVQFRSTEAANSVVVRFVIPDSEDGKGLESTISLYVDDVFRQKIQLTSKYAWSYGGEEETFNVPKAGGAHHFYDEARALVGDIPAGATVKLQVDEDDTAEYYVIDLIDLEQVDPPLTKPDGYISIEECGAVPDGGQDAGDAIQDCIDKAKAAKTGIWIPAGTFESEIHGFDVADVTIQGAGMWYSTIHGKYARFNCTGDIVALLTLPFWARQSCATTNLLKMVSMAAPAAARNSKTFGWNIPRLASGSAAARMA